VKEKLQKFALIAEIVGGVAIIASLIFVGVQINQNHEMMRAQIRNDIATTLSERLWNMSQSERPDLFDNEASLELLTDNEKLRVGLWMSASFRMYENMYYQYKMGLFDEKEFEVETVAWKSVFNSPRAKASFCRNPYAFSVDFRNYVFSIMETPC